MKKTKDTYTINISRETEPRNPASLLPPATLYTVTVLRAGKQVGGASGAPSPMLLAQASEAMGRSLKMEAFGKVLGAAAKLIIQDSAERML